MKKNLTLLCLLLSINFVAIGQDKSNGKACFYSDKLQGRTMSNGEKYDRDSMTCAHLKFPLGTQLKVRNPINGKEVIVKVTDRGPYSNKYIIDLSRAAAKELNIISSGFCQVEITPYHKNQIPYKPESDLEEIPELNLEYSPAATYPEPAWQRDSLSMKKSMDLKTVTGNGKTLPKSADSKAKKQAAKAPDPSVNRAEEEKKTN